MVSKHFKNLSLGRILGLLTKQYIGLLAKKMKNTPIDRYYHPMLLIGKNSGKINQQQLADQLLTDKVSIVRVLDCLSKDGLIERKVNPDDRREHLLSVTAKGLPWVEEIEKAEKETEEIFLSFLPVEIRVEFYEELKKLCGSVMELPVEEVELFYNHVDESDDEKTE
jgi:MarR family transcriptional regulator for hemolysin